MLVIGDAVLDITVRPSEPMEAGSDVPAAVAVGVGGQAANVAVRLARRGVAVQLVSALGHDTAGRLVADGLAAEAVRLQRVAVAATGTVVVLIDEAGERTMLSQRSPFASSTDIGDLPDAPWTVVSGYVLLEPGADRFAGKLARAAGRRAVVGCAVPADDRLPWLDAVRHLRPDLIVLNAQEYAALHRGALDTVSVVVVTGADSVRAFAGSDSVQVRVADAEPAVDTTGAGDAFAAALIALVPSEPWPPRADALAGAIRAADALGAEVSRVAGAQARVASEAELAVR